MLKKQSKAAKFLLLLIFLLAVGSLAAIWTRASGLWTENGDSPLIADLYQNGSLLTSIDLTAVTESYTFLVTAPDGGSNLVEVRPGEIGIREADCPDQICVRQGFIHTSLLPVTCLPHRLVIQVRGKYGTEGPNGTRSFDEAEPPEDIDAVVR